MHSDPSDPGAAPIAAYVPRSVALIATCQPPATMLLAAAAILSLVLNQYNKFRGSPWMVGWCGCKGKGKRDFPHFPGSFLTPSSVCCPPGHLILVPFKMF